MALMSQAEGVQFDRWLRQTQGERVHAPLWVMRDWASVVLHRHVEREEILGFLQGAFSDGPVAPDGDRPPYVR